MWLLCATYLPPLVTSPQLSSPLQSLSPCYFLDYEACCGLTGWKSQLKHSLDQHSCFKPSNEYLLRGLLGLPWLGLHCRWWAALPGHSAPDMLPCYRLGVLWCQVLSHPQKASRKPPDCPEKNYALLTPVSLLSALFLPLTLTLHVTYCLGNLKNLCICYYVYHNPPPAKHEIFPSSVAQWPREWGMSNFHL